jgi:hypothetical protein
MFTYCRYNCIVSKLINNTETTLHIFINPITYKVKSLDSSALGYRLNDQGSRVRLPVGAGNFFLHHRVQNGSGAHPASYTMGIGVSFPEGKATGA